MFCHIKKAPEPSQARGLDLDLSLFLGGEGRLTENKQIYFTLNDNLLTNLLYNAEFVLIPIASSMGVKV